MSKTIARLIEKEAPETGVLLMNSETNSGEYEQDSIQPPDTVLEQGKYDITVCFLSVATGVMHWQC